MYLYKSPSHPHQILASTRKIYGMVGWTLDSRNTVLSCSRMVGSTLDSRNTVLSCSRQSV